jgi:alginate O-acetyltransferase complex protein AlgI
MVFTSGLFLLYFFPFFLLIFFIISGILKNSLKNVVLLLASVAFYIWGAPIFILLLLFSAIVVYYLARYVNYHQGIKRKRIFVLSVILVLGQLVYFKYTNFFIETINSISSGFGLHAISFLKIAIPLGISFYTFHLLSYLIDVYRKKRAPFQKLSGFILYIMLFPKLIAGPIVRYHEFADQVENKHRDDGIDNRLVGFVRFCIGLAKKILIANVLGLEADRIFSVEPAILSTPEVWIGTLAYTFQIYFDFAGYSDMAIGIARMLGFVFPENFNSPYISRSITEFWKRWHITLSMWFREYLFLPLAYKLSKKLPKEKYFGIRTDYLLYIYAALITFALCGFWHGATWTFLIWGVYHGFFIASERLFLLKFYKFIGKYLSILFTFLVVSLGWVLFRAESIKQALIYMKKMFSFDFANPVLSFSSEFWAILIIAVFFSFFTLSKPGRFFEEKVFVAKYPWPRLIIMVFLSILIYYLTICNISSVGFNPFIYARF